MGIALFQKSFKLIKKDPKPQTTAKKYEESCNMKQKRRNMILCSSPWCHLWSTAVKTDSDLQLLNQCLGYGRKGYVHCLIQLLWLIGEHKAGNNIKLPQVWVGSEMKAMPFFVVMSTLWNILLPDMDGLNPTGLLWGPKDLVLCLGLRHLKPEQGPASWLS